MFYEGSSPVCSWKDVALQWSGMGRGDVKDACVKEAHWYEIRTGTGAT